MGNGVLRLWEAEPSGIVGCVVSASTPARGRPPRTSREQILSAAQTVIDRDGWERLTIRRLAGEIGMSPATVYNHVRDKDDLLVQLLGMYAEHIPRGELPSDPEERILAAARTMHDALADRPWVVDVLTTDDLLGESALWMVEAILAAASDLGIDPDRAVHLYRNIWYLTVGEILVRARRADRRAATGGGTYRQEALARLDPNDHPQLAGLARRWEALTADE